MWWDGFWCSRSDCADRGYGRGPTYSAFRQRKIRTLYRCTMLALVKANSRPLHSSITVRLIDTNIQKGIFFILMRSWITGWLDDTELWADTAAYAQGELIAYPNQLRNRAWFVYRSPHQHEIDKVRTRQETRAFISKMILRKWMIEGLFAEVKQFHGLRRARYRGLKKAAIQALMTAMAQNIKRIVKQLLDICWLLRRYLHPRKKYWAHKIIWNTLGVCPNFFYINQPSHRASFFNRSSELLHINSISYISIFFI